MKNLKKTANVKGSTVERYALGARGTYECYCYCSCPPPSVPNDFYLKAKSDSSTGKTLLVKYNS